jgi:hypothetical protein
MTLMAKLIEVPASSDPTSNLEVALLDTALEGSPPAAKTQPEDPKPAKTMQHEIEAKPPVQVDPHPALARKRAAETKNKEEDEPEKTPSTAVLDQAAWPKVLTAVKQNHNTLYSIARAASPHFEPGVVTLECAYAFHQKKLNEKATKKTLADIIQSVTGQTVRVVSVKGGAPDTANDLPPELPPVGEKIHTVAAPDKPQAARQTEAPPTQEVKAISNIFGGAELLE